MQSASPVELVWLRDDLRINDNPALFEGMKHGEAWALYILDTESAGIRELGGAAKWWLHHALKSMASQLRELGVPLILRLGDPQKVFRELQKEASISSVRWNRRYSPSEIAVDARIKEQMGESGIQAHSYCGFLLKEPWEIQTVGGTGYKVFTPFYNRLLELNIRKPLPAPEAQSYPQGNLPASEDLASWQLIPHSPNWARGLEEAWEPGENAVYDRLELLIDSIITQYPKKRDRPDIDGTSALSPALRWGHLSPVVLWRELGRVASADPDKALGCYALRRQLAWREFCWHLLFHNPQMLEENLRAEFDDYGWVEAGESKEADALIASWNRGETGYAMVDAGMKQLWQTGWMHNRVRMLVGSFLVKNLGVHWKVGEEWFWDTLVDADLASNSANWQWVAGSGADAAPFFRVFNPEVQGKKFDPLGVYRGRFAPLSCEPIVDLRESRQNALEAYEQMRQLHRSAQS